MNSIKLPPKLDKLLSDFVQELRDVYKDDLVSITLYGSASSGEFVDKLSNVNVAIVLSKAGLSDLAKARPFIGFGKFSMINPVFFTEIYIKRSVDVFPIEFLDMKENHTVLHGKDIFKDIHVDLKNLRFQCEQELKSKLINLKSLFIRARGEKELRDVLFKSFNSTLHISRNLLRLKGKTPPYAKNEILHDLAREFKVDTGRLSAILIAKKDMLRLSYKAVDALFSDFVEALEHIVEIADTF